MCWIRHDSSFPFSKLFGSTEQRSSVLSRFISSDIVAMLRAILGKSQGPCIHAIGAPQLYQKSVKASSTRLFWNSGIPSLNIVFSISIYIYYCCILWHIYNYKCIYRLHCHYYISCTLVFFDTWHSINVSSSVEAAGCFSSCPPLWQPASVTWTDRIGQRPVSCQAFSLGKYGYYIYIPSGYLT